MEKEFLSMGATLVFSPVDRDIGPVPKDAV